MTGLFSQIITPVFIGFVAAIIGALPFGLVNLNVVKFSLLGQKPYAVKVMHGAAFVEILYGLIAILAGGAVFVIAGGNLLINTIVGVILFGAGLYFFMKKPVSKVNGNSHNKGLLYGALLNLLSFQVLLYWIVALVFIHSRNLLPFSILSSVAFITGLWAGKIATLSGYIYFTNKILSRSQFFEKNINRVIGVILLAASILQGVKLII